MMDEGRAEKVEGNELRVDQYLLLFLKFMAAVLPTMNFDCIFNLIIDTAEV